MPPAYNTLIYISSGPGAFHLDTATKNFRDFLKNRLSRIFILKYVGG